MQLLIDRCRISCFRFVWFDCFVGKRNARLSAEDIMRAMPRDHTQPGRKFIRVAHAPPRLPSRNEGILYYVFGFLAVLQNAVSNGEKRPTVCANDHFECFSIAVYGRRSPLAFTGIRFVSI